tara:strand:- start:973 stop:1308 length:336 start_codon:yes stop_codon:yes gene_type:complete
VDPGFGASADPISVAAALTGVTLINLGDADRLGAVDVRPSGNDLTRRLPDAHYVEIAPAHHFTFRAACKPGAADMLDEEGEDPIAPIQQARTARQPIRIWLRLSLTGLDCR